MRKEPIDPKGWVRGGVAGVSPLEGVAEDALRD